MVSIKKEKGRRAAANTRRATLTPGIPKLRETDARELLLGPRLRIQKERE